MRPVEFHSRRRERRSSSHRSVLACKPRDRMSRPGIAFPAIPAVRTCHRPDDIESERGNEYASSHISVTLCRGGYTHTPNCFNIDASLF